MLKIFFDTLARPKQIASHVDEKPKIKFVGFFIILMIILTIPTFLTQIFNFNFTAHDTERLTKAFESNQVIDYKIENNKLIYTGEGETSKLQYVKVSDNNMLSISDLPIYFVFTLQDEKYQINQEDALVLVFKSDKAFLYHINGNSNIDNTVKLASTTSGESLLKEMNYESLNINFNKDTTNHQQYTNMMFNLGSKIYNELRWSIIANNALYIVLINVGVYFLSILFTVALLGLFTRFMGVKFGKVLKIAILSSNLYILASLISFLYGIEFIAYIGEILSFFYTLTALRQYAIIDKINSSKI